MLRKAYRLPAVMSVFLFDAPPTTEIYTLSLHDALPISIPALRLEDGPVELALRGYSPGLRATMEARTAERDRKSTRLNSSHITISYAVFCLKKKNTATLTLTGKPQPRHVR